MAESDVRAMKETLGAQQQLLQKLYTELDQEREASATAASEAMDMMLRLQGEKAAVKMESSHYKRMAEEKIGHAEATLEVFEELMYQKGMEIASLQFQVLAYKHKILTLGYDFNATEFEFPDPEDMLLNRNDQQSGENSQISSTVRRLHSLPAIQSKNAFGAARKRERSPSPASVPIPVPNPEMTPQSNKHEATSPNFAYGTLDSYWNQIKRLDEKVKVISDCKDSSRGEKCAADLRSRRGRSCSIFSQASTKIIRDQTYRLPLPPTNSDKVNHRDGTHDTNREAVANTSCSVNGHDVFEVPQTSENHKVSEHGEKRLEGRISDSDNRLTKPDLVSEETVESHVKHEMDKLKSVLSAHLDIKISSPKDMVTIDWQKKEGMNAVCIAEAEFQKLNQRVERERNSTRQEIMHELVDKEEHLRLLKDIYTQVKLIQCEIRSGQIKKAGPKEDVSLCPLQEVIYCLFF